MCCEISGIVAARRLADGCRALDDLLSQLSNGDRVAELVHSARKLGKSLRGGCALFGLEKSAGRAIQAVGRLLAARRDVASRRKTWDRLGWNDGSTAATAIVAMLERQVAASITPPPAEAIAWCREQVAIAEDAISALDADALDACAVDELAKLERTVIKRCKRMRRHGEGDFHNARKALKAYLGAVDFACGEMGPVKRLAELADLLGDENDLATLRHWLIAHGFTRNRVPGLIGALDERRAEIRARVLEAETGSPWSGDL